MHFQPTWSSATPATVSTYSAVRVSASTRHSAFVTVVPAGP
ncbi:hypothetical protein [Micromonospora maritima]